MRLKVKSRVQAGDDEEHVVEAGGLTGQQAGRLAGRMVDRSKVSRNKDMTGGTLRQKETIVTRSTRKINTKTNSQVRGQDLYQRTWLNNLTMTAWRTRVVLLRLMSRMAAGETSE